MCGCVCAVASLRLPIIISLRCALMCVGLHVTVSQCACAMACCLRQQNRYCIGHDNERTPPLLALPPRPDRSAPVGTPSPSTPVSTRPKCPPPWLTHHRDGPTTFSSCCRCVPSSTKNDWQHSSSSSSVLPLPSCHLPRSSRGVALTDSGWHRRLAIRPIQGRRLPPACLPAAPPSPRPAPCPPIDRSHRAPRCVVPPHPAALPPSVLSRATVPPLRGIILVLVVVAAVAVCGHAVPRGEVPARPPSSLSPRRLPPSPCSSSSRLVRPIHTNQYLIHALAHRWSAPSLPAL